MGIKNGLGRIKKEKEMKKLLSISVLLMFFGVMLVADSGYALTQKGKTRQGGDEAAERLDEKGRPRKGSIYDAESWLISTGLYEGNVFTRNDFQENSGINPATGKAYSDSTIDRELGSLVKVGLLKSDGHGNYYVPAGINHDVLDAINAEVEKLIPRKEAGTDRALGLRRFDLADLPAKTLQRISVIVEEKNLKNNTAVNIAAFDSEFAENHGEVLLNIIKELRPDQVPVIVNATGRKLSLIPGLANIHIEAVEVASPAAEQFAEMFENQKYVGLKGTIDSLKKAIAEGEVRI